MTEKDELRAQLDKMSASYETTKARTTQNLDFLYPVEAHEEVLNLFKGCDVAMAYVEERFDTLADNPARYLNMVNAMAVAYKRLQDLSFIGRP